MLAKVIVLLVLISQTICLDMCDKNNSYELNVGDYTVNGTDVIWNNTLYTINEYYMDSNGTIRTCDCVTKTCLKKCCPDGMGYHVGEMGCVPLEVDFNPPVWKKTYQLRGVGAGDIFRFVPGKVICTRPRKRVRVGLVAKYILIKRNGDLYVSLPNQVPPWTILSPDKYCVDTFLRHQNANATLDAFICHLEPQEENAYLLTTSCMIISCVFILATCAVYAWLPELHNLHGRVLIAYLLCLFVSFSLLASMQILLLLDNITLNMCVGLTIGIYFFLLSAFFWMNVMSFDIWWTFSGKRGLSLEKLSIRGRFFAYALYAFSIPTALTILLAALEFSGLPSHPWLPKIRQQGCFLYGQSKLIYLYGPITVLCIANSVFFILTTIKIAQIKQQTSVLKSKESSKHDMKKDKQRLWLYVKLFAVMGINWILEVVSSFYPKANFIWRIFDAYNVLMGLTIFIIFVCKRKIYYLMKKRIKEVFHHESNNDLRTFNIKHARPWLNENNGTRPSIDTVKSNDLDGLENKTTTTRV